MTTKGNVPLRIVQLSDLHFAPAAEAERNLRRAANQIHELYPDLIIVSGDLSREGLAEQFEPVYRFLVGLGLERVRAIPGNRDYPATRTAVPRPSDSDLHYFLVAPDTAEVESDTPGRAENWTLFTEYFSAVDVYERLPGLALVALDSEPCIPPESMERAMLHFAGAEPSDARVFCTHRSLLPVPGKRVKDGDLLPNAGAVLAELIQARIDVVLCSHLHHAHVWQIGDGEWTSIVVNSPSLLDRSGGKVPGFMSIDIDEEIIVRHHLLLDGSVRPMLQAWRCLRIVREPVLIGV